MHDTFRLEERLEALERKANLMKDVLLTLAKERHAARGHEGYFPSPLTLAYDECKDDACQAAYRMANE